MLVKIKNNKKKVLSVVSVCILLLLVIGVTYAAYNGNFFSSEYSIKTGTVSIELLETTEVISISNALPMGDNQGKSQTDTYDFNVITEATGDISLSYVLYLEKLEVDPGFSTLTDEQVKFYLTDENDNVLVGPTKINQLETYFYTKTNIHSKTNTRIEDNYKIRVWIDSAVYPTGWEENPHQYKFKIGVKTLNPLDTSNANKPVLSANMLPVYYDETCDENVGCWRKADSTNTNEEHKWYNYDEKMWANSVTVSSTNRSTYLTATEGTKIPMEDILTMQVWIPRYKYKVWNYNLSGTVTSQPQEIQITFEKGNNTTGDISCTDSIFGTTDGTSSGTESAVSEICKIGSTECTDDLCNNKTYTHPAFTFKDKELTGIWVGKFELSSDLSCSKANSAAINEEGKCNLTSIRPLIKPNLNSWRGAMVSVFENNMMAMNDTNNKYGFSSTDDTHMIKNIEWGAVAYLSHSKYGIKSDMTKNSNNLLTTGCGPQSEGSNSSGSLCNAYDTELGKSSSTTGNIYGIYDMSGGSSEYVMGNIMSPNGTVMMAGTRADESYPNNYSGYSGIVYNSNGTEGSYGAHNGFYEYPDNKYYDKYSFNTNEKKRSISKLGDAIKEVYATANYNWYKDYSYLSYNERPWFLRGGYYNDGSGYAGIFNSYYTYGYAYRYYSSRLVISQ